MSPRIAQIIQVHARFLQNCSEPFLIARIRTTRIEVGRQDLVNVFSRLHKVIDPVCPHDRATLIPFAHGTFSVADNLRYIRRSRHQELRLVRFAPRILQRPEINAALQHFRLQGVEIADESSLFFHEVATRGFEELAIMKEVLLLGSMRCEIVLRVEALVWSR